VKKVVNTKWWPSGTEKAEESIGIISHGFVYMTAMMEVNATFNATEAGIVSDVRDIAIAAGADLPDLVDCFINAPKGKAGEIRRTFLAALEKPSRPALTVAEMPGEAPFIPTSASCVLALPAAGASTRREVRAGDYFGVAARGLLHIEEAHGRSGASVAEQVAGALAGVKEVVLEAGGHGLEDLVDCTAVIVDVAHAQVVQAALENAKAAPALTIVQGGLEDPMSSVALRCVAALRPGAVKRVPGAVAAEGLVWASGVLGRQSTGADAFTELQATLRSVGAQMSDVVNCMFFLKDGAKVLELFEEFYKEFNQRSPPPPTRGEYVAASTCADCQLHAKCIAALRQHPTQEAFVV